MDEVLVKADKYINGEEALLSKRENSSAQKEKIRGEKKRERSTRRRGDEETRIDPHEGTGKTENGLQRDKATSGTAWAHLSPSYNSDIHPDNSPP